MEIYKFSKESGRRISKFNSNFIMSRIMQTDKATNIGCMHLEAKGIVGYHQAVVPQLLLVINGEGHVRNETNNFIKVQVGDAVYWEKDEWHETKTDNGLTAIVIESLELDSSIFMSLKNSVD